MDVRDNTGCKVCQLQGNKKTYWKKIVRFLSHIQNGDSYDGTLRWTQKIHEWDWGDVVEFLSVNRSSPVWRRLVNTCHFLYIICPSHRDFSAEGHITVHRPVFLLLRSWMTQSIVGIISFFSSVELLLTTWQKVLLVWAPACTTQTNTTSICYDNLGKLINQWTSICVIRILFLFSLCFLMNCSGGHLIVRSRNGS